MKKDNLWIESFVVGALSMRCSVITDLSSGDTVIIDGGAESSRIIDWINGFSGQGPDWSNGPKNHQELSQHGISNRNVIALVNTHAHFDHSGEIPYLLNEYNVSWYLHKDDFYLQSLVQLTGYSTKILNRLYGVKVIYSANLLVGELTLYLLYFSAPL